MKRIVVGLMILGLVIGGFLSCVLNAPDVVDQTQVDGLLATLSADGAFGQEISKTYELGYVVDGWEYTGDLNGDGDMLDAGEGILGEAVRYTLTFDVDGNWEWKMEAFESIAKTSTTHQSQTADLENGDAVTAGDWVQVSGTKGTYAYDATTKVLTVNYGGIIFVNDTTPAYDPVWTATTNDPVVGQQLLASKPIVFMLFDEDILTFADVVTNYSVAETTIATVVLGAFDYGFDGRRYFGSDSVETEKYWANTSLTAREYQIDTDTQSLTFGDTEMTYQATSVRTQDNGTAADTYSDLTADLNYYVYEVELDAPLANGQQVNLVSAYLQETYALTFVSASGTFTRATTFALSDNQVAGIGTPLYDDFQMYGDGYIAY